MSNPALIEHLSDYREEEIEDRSSDLDEYRACDIDECDDEDDAETRIPFHPFGSSVPPYLYQSVSVKRRDRDEIEDGERYIEIAEAYPEIDHEIVGV